jgi:hypothetical protein
MVLGQGVLLVQLLLQLELLLEVESGNNGDGISQTETADDNGAGDGGGVETEGHLAGSLSWEIRPGK